MATRMGRKKKAATRRSKTRSAGRPSAAKAPEREPGDQRLASWLRAHVGASATACGLGGCYVGTIQEVLDDGLVMQSDGRRVLLSYHGLEMTLMVGGQPGALPPGGLAMPEPPTRGIPPEEDVF